ncbi:MAG TPA: hypothetical protein VFS67_36900 [Polyangiaceae bacterium]|jgi:hypothetical protein|nr:hypothetical protein [Polyangiaceae bacterium]
MNWKKAYSALLAQLDALGLNVARRELLVALQAWLQRQLAAFSPALQEDYGLRGYSSLDLARYPIEGSSLNADEEVRQLRLVPPSSADGLAMRVRDIFWSGLTIESGIECPRFKDSELRILMEEGTEQLVRACDVCLWAETRDGEHWQPGGRLVPPTIEQLERWALTDGGKRA